MADINKKSKETYDAHHKSDMAWLAGEIDEWKSERRGILTTTNIEFFAVLADKTPYRRKLDGAQRQMKTDIHQSIGAAIRDIDMMIKLELIGGPSRWDPSNRDGGKHELPFSTAFWKEDIPVSSLANMVECMVRMFGDEYAVPLADGVRRGLQSREQSGSSIEVDVPVVRRNKQPSP